MTDSVNSETSIILHMIRFAVACQGTQCIRTYLANFYTSAARDFSGLRCRGDLSSYDVGETPDDQLDFKRHCPISICLEARSIGVRIFWKFSRFPKIFDFSIFGKFSIEIQLFSIFDFSKILGEMKKSKKSWFFRIFRKFFDLDFEIDFRSKMFNHFPWFFLTAESIGESSREG